ncbi:MAG: SAM-dependent DNA methyltransferase [Deinococcus-Thermus bacterium]|nr:MAG: SAM-dependent DNA methyltransferase [Deinococcota bacterium]
MTLDALTISPRGEAAKALGAYYTNARVARFLVRWALRAPHETLADPAFGGGVFLAAAAERLGEMRGHPDRQLFGVEVDQEAHSRAARVLEAHFSIPPDHLLCADFFELSPTALRVDAVVGNPPFIRYQRFLGRKKALLRAAEQGVRLSGRAGSWAAFLVHATAFLKPGGRLAMVLPAELGHAQYAQPVLEYLKRAFERLWLISFRERLFPRLGQDALLLLAEGRQGGQGTPSAAPAYLLELEGPADLEDLRLPPEGEKGPKRLWVPGAGGRLPFHRLPQGVRGLYEALAKAPQTFRLGEVAEVGIGYVTGNNGFFHLSPEGAGAWGIPPQFLKPSVWRARALKGLRFTQTDWAQATSRGQAGFLLHLPPEAPLPPGVRAYLAKGQAAGVPQAYKCRTRRPWYSVPYVGRPDAFLAYMGQGSPHLAVNEAGAVAPNSLYGLRLKAPGQSALALAALWQTSLTRLSAELEGHPLGGGALKLEPAEAEQVLLAGAGLAPKRLLELALELDALLREGRPEEARALADQVVLQEGLGLSKGEVALLAQAQRLLKERRGKR